MNTIVSKSSPVVVVGPSEPDMPTDGIINLSSFDKFLVPVPTTQLLVFDRPIGDPIGTIKKALSQALVHYHPMAGRIVAAVGGDEGELAHIACTGEGVSFVAASASCTLDEAVKTSSLLLMDLAVRYPTEYCGLGDSLLLMQVTEFTCGGFVVGVTWNHVMADGHGMAQFLQAVGELARGMPVPSVVPVRSDVDGALPCLPSEMVAAVRSQIRIETEELASLDVTVPSSVIGRIKAECGGDCTAFDAVAAVLWRCRTRAAISDDDPDALAPLVFTKNVRELVGAKNGYYGNCLAIQMVLATRGTVASSGIKDLVKLIKLAKEKMPDILLENANGGTDDHEAHEQQAPPRYNALTLTSWRNLGFEAVDFGSGGASRVMWRTEQTVGFVCVVCPPCKEKDGINVMSLCVKPDHADAFLQEMGALNI